MAGRAAAGGGASCEDEGRGLAACLRFFPRAGEVAAWGLAAVAMQGTQHGSGGVVVWLVLLVKDDHDY